MSDSVDSLIPRRGERALVCGQTGSGKTVAMAAIARALAFSERVAIIDTKIEPRYRRLPRSLLVRHPSAFWAPESSGEKRTGPAVHIWRPSPEISQSPVALDDALYSLYQHYTGPLILDELYPFHRGGQAGPGMIALLTRGRSRGITTIMGSQRPLWISRFCLSEAQHYWAYTLVDRADRRRLSEVIPNFPTEAAVARYYFLYWNNGLQTEKPLLFAPLSLQFDEAEEKTEKEVDNVLRWV